MSQPAKRTCGPCNGRCYQGRNCPARLPREHVLDYFAKVFTSLRRGRPATPAS